MFAMRRSSFSPLRQKTKQGNKARERGGLRAHALPEGGGGDKRRRSTAELTSLFASGGKLSMGYGKTVWLAAITEPLMSCSFASTLACRTKKEESIIRPRIRHKCSGRLRLQ